MYNSNKYELYWQTIEDGDDLSQYDISDYLDIVITVEIDGTSSRGWVGLGYGDTPYMNDKDISWIKYSRNGDSTDSNNSQTDSFTCYDSYSEDWGPETDSDINSDSSNDIYDCSVSFEDNTITVAFKRPLAATDSGLDNEIPTSGTSYFIAAYNDRQSSQKHNTS